MTESETNEIYLSSSPHFSSGLKTQHIMLAVLVSLLPECVYGVVLFGIRALVTILVSVAGAVLFEALFQKIIKQKVSVNNLSAAVTGVLLALVCPPSIPIWMILLGDLFAVVVAKGLFGGLGANVFNPALTGRAFLFVSFSSVMGASWLKTSGDFNKWSYSATSISNVDAISSATVLSGIKAGTFELSSGTFLQFFLGNKEGCIGETSVLLILISFLFLVASKVIDWRAPLAMVGTVAVATFISSFIALGDAVGALSEVLLALMTGGLLFGATFMVTDYATTPVTKPGRLLFGFGCGLVTFLIRRFGGYPEGVMFSILIMNALAPFMNYLTVRKYGYGKKGHAKKTPKIIVQEFNTNDAKASAEASK